MSNLKTVDYNSKLLDFQIEQVLFLKFYYYAHGKKLSFLKDTLNRDSY